MSNFLWWVSFTHTMRWHAHDGTGGQGDVDQSRLKSFPVQDDEPFLLVCRYVERNALRAGLVRRTEDWTWGSLNRWLEEPKRKSHTIPTKVQLANTTRANIKQTRPQARPSKTQGRATQDIQFSIHPGRANPTRVGRPFGSATLGCYVALISSGLTPIDKDTRPHS